MKTSILSLACLALFLSLVALKADDSIATAIEIQPGEASAALSPVGDLDYFKFTIDSAQMVTIATKAASVGVPATNCKLFLYDSQRHGPGQHIASSGTPSKNQIMKFLQPGTYYVTVSSYISNATGAYRLVLRTQSSAIPINQVVQGNLDVANDWKLYQFTVETPGYVLLRARRPRVSTPPINLTMIVRDEAGNQLEYSSGATASFEDVLNPGNYFVTITSAFSGDFNLKLTTPDSAVTIRDGTTSGQIELPRDHDYYRFVVSGNAPSVVRLLTSGSAKLGLWLQNEFGQSKALYGFSQTHDREATLDPGIYFLLLYGNEDSGVGAYGDYSLTLTGLTPGFPEIDVQQPAGSALADGKSKRSFGTAVADAKKGITKTFVIRNAGTKTLTGIKVSKSGKQAGDFQIKTQPASSLAVGKQTTFKVTFLPKAAGAKSASLRISSNDANENPFDIPVSGQAVKR